MWDSAEYLLELRSFSKTHSSTWTIENEDISDIDDWESNNIDTSSLLWRTPMFGINAQWESYYFTVLNEISLFDSDFPSVPICIVRLILSYSPFDTFEIVSICDQNGLWNLGQIMQIRRYIEADDHNSDDNSVAVIGKPIELRVHYLGWSVGIDEWLPIDSPRIQPIKHIPNLPSVMMSINEFRFWDLRSYIFYGIVTHQTLEKLNELIDDSTNDLPFQLLFIISSLIDSINGNTLAQRRTAVSLLGDMAMNDSNPQSNQSMTVATIDVLALRDTIPIILAADLNKSAKLRSKSLKVSLEETFLYFGEGAIIDIINRGANVIVSHFNKKLKRFQ